MPYTFAVDETLGCVFVKLRGTVTYDDLLAFKRELEAQPNFRRGLHRVFDYRDAEVSITSSDLRRVASAFKGVKAAIHQNHGLFSASRHSIDSAASWFIALERCCQQQLLVEATGSKPVQVPVESARYSREHVGSEYIGWLHFQPIYQYLAERSPEMFD